MTYEEVISYFETFVNYERKTGYHYKTAFKLERMKKLLSNLGNPQKDLKIIHIAGTKGKGSTSCFVASILKEAGFKVGLYTSPHLNDYRERIRILDPNNTADEKSSFPGMILKNDFMDLLFSLKPQIDFFKRSFQNFGSLTLFEVLTAMAIKFFREKGVDFVVLETGLGGRFDATNATDSLVSVITPISYDHEHVLGNTLPEIAFEKAGIIKTSNIKTKDGVSICIIAQQGKDVKEVLKRRAKAQQAVLFEAGKDFSFKPLSAGLLLQSFFYKGLNNSSFFFDIKMLGGHQLINASLAIAVCEALSLYGIKIKSDFMAGGLLKTFWPGRLEVVSTRPFIILDGAHNKDSTSRLVNFLEKEFKDARKWLIFGACMDKDVKGLAGQLEPFADRVILTRVDNPRAADPQTVLKPYFKNKVETVTDTVEEAMDVLNKKIQPDEVGVVTGSLFVVGEARLALSKIV